MPPWELIWLCVVSTVSLVALILACLLSTNYINHFPDWSTRLQVPHVHSDHITAVKATLGQVRATSLQLPDQGRAGRLLVAADDQGHARWQNFTQA